MQSRFSKKVETIIEYSIYAGISFLVGALASFGLLILFSGCQSPQNKPDHSLAVNPSALKTAPYHLVPARAMKRQEVRIIEHDGKRWTCWERGPES